MTMFETTTTGYRATDDAVAFWSSRDLCPSCSAVVTPTDKTLDGRWQYRCDCDGAVEWTSYSPTDTNGPEGC